MFRFKVQYVFLCVWIYTMHAENKLQHHHPIYAGKLRRDYWFCGKEEADNECVNLSSGESLRGKWPEQSSAERSLRGGIATHKHTHIHFSIKKERRVAQDKDKKKLNRKLRTNGPKSRHPICFTHAQTQTSTKSNKQSLQQPRAIWGNSWFLPVFHKGTVIYSCVDDNLIMTNSRTAQFEPQQVRNVDTGHTKWVSARYSVLLCRMRNRLIDLPFALGETREGGIKRQKPLEHCFIRSPQ